jgi:hypothetical protein
MFIRTAVRLRSSRRAISASQIEAERRPRLQAVVTCRYEENGPLSELDVVLPSIQAGKLPTGNKIQLGMLGVGGEKRTLTG